MNLCSIASGSSGNCIYVGTERTHLIVDAGISGKRIEAGLNAIGLKTAEMNGILITHEHSDHIGALGVLARRYGLPMYATKGTIEGIKDAACLGRIPDELLIEIKAEEPFRINDIAVNPVRISHDAREPVAYRFDHEGHSIGVVTDLGNYDDHIVAHFAGVNGLLLEANHDVNRLLVGRYPYPLKQRILGDAGHLSNELSGRLLCRLLHEELNVVLLGHLSAENNIPELAYETVRLEVLMDENDYRPEDFRLSVASRHECSALIAV